MHQLQHQPVSVYARLCQQSLVHFDVQAAATKLLLIILPSVLPVPPPLATSLLQSLGETWATFS